MKQFSILSHISNYRELQHGINYAKNFFFLFNYNKALLQLFIICDSNSMK
jgi:hypothetical protein